jgi:hypothetical protein
VIVANKKTDMFDISLEEVGDPLSTTLCSVFMDSVIKKLEFRT